MIMGLTAAQLGTGVGKEDMPGHACTILRQYEGFIEITETICTLKSSAKLSPVTYRKRRLLSISEQKTSKARNKAEFEDFRP